MKQYFISIKNFDFFKKIRNKNQKGEDGKIYAKGKTVDFSLDCHVKNLFQVLVVVKKKEKGDDGLVRVPGGGKGWEEGGGSGRFGDVCRKSRSCRLCKFSSIRFLLNEMLNFI